MTAPTDPSQHLWWLASRSAGIVAMVAVTASVLIGLGMSTKMMRRRGITPMLAPFHEQLSLIGLVAIAVHGITLLGDPWLRPGLAGIAVPLQIDYRPGYVAAGIVAAWLGAILGLSFYARRWIGAQRWRKVHRLTSLVYVLSVVHTIGAGTDAVTRPLRLALIYTGAPVCFLLLVRLFPDRQPAPEPARENA